MSQFTCEVWPRRKSTPSVVRMTEAGGIFVRRAADGVPVSLAERCSDPRLLSDWRGSFRSKIVGGGQANQAIIKDQKNMWSSC